MCKVLRSHVQHINKIYWKIEKIKLDTCMIGNAYKYCFLINRY